MEHRNVRDCLTFLNVGLRILMVCHVDYFLLYSMFDHVAYLRYEILMVFYIRVQMSTYEILLRASDSIIIPCPIITN